MVIGQGAIMDNPFSVIAPPQRSAESFGRLPQKNFLATPDLPRNATHLPPNVLDPAAATQIPELEGVLKTLAEKSQAPDEAPVPLPAKKDTFLSKLLSTEGVGGKAKMLIAALLAYLGFNFYKGGKLSNQDAQTQSAG